MNPSINYDFSSNLKRLSFSGSVISGIIILTDLLMIPMLGGLMLSAATNTDSYNGLTPYVIAILTNTFLLVSVFNAYGLYRPELINQRSFQLRRMQKLTVACVLALATIGFTLDVTHYFSRTWLFSWLALLLLLLPAQRLLFSILILRWCRTGRITRNVAVIGNTRQASKLLEVIADASEPWVRMIGVFDDRSEARSDEPDMNIAMGRTNELEKLVRDNHIDEIVVALPDYAEERIIELLRRIEHLPVKVSICPNFIGLRLGSVRAGTLAGVPILAVYEVPISGWRTIIKSIFDYSLGSIAMVFATPVMLAIAICIKLESKGPIFFAQDRVGFNGKIFKVYKFRSMYTDMVDKNADTLVGPGDPRVTRVGRFLRRTSLDELPQLLNVMTGTMSLVGPRPHALNAKAAGVRYEESTERYLVRHKVKPGITGWAQVNGWRGETSTTESIRKRTEFDLLYVYNWSVYFDLIILIRTVWAVISGKNAH